MAKRRMTVGSPYGDSDTGNRQYPDYGPTLNGTVYPMQSYNNCETRKSNRRPSQSDVDNSPWPIRRYTNMSTSDVQLHNGLRMGIASGRRSMGHPYGKGYLYAIVPRIPGQTRDNAGGFHKRGPSPYNVQDIFDSGPGSQPEHPGGPGQIAAVHYVNPMTG
jgi:hypothetical protein